MNSIINVAWFSTPKCLSLKKRIVAISVNTLVSRKPKYVPSLKVGIYYLVSNQHGPCLVSMTWNISWYPLRKRVSPFTAWLTGDEWLCPGMPAFLVEWKKRPAKISLIVWRHDGSMRRSGTVRCCGPKRDLHAQLGLQNLISCLHSSCHHQSSHHYITTSFLLVLINVSNAQGPWWFATRYTACCIVITF